VFHPRDGLFSWRKPTNAINCAHAFASDSVRYSLPWLLSRGVDYCHRGLYIAKNSKMTADRVRAYAQSVDLGKLSADARRKRSAIWRGS